MKSECVTCGRRIAWRFSLCSNCDDKYGRRKADRPQWLNEMINHSRKERRLEEKGWLQFMADSDLAYHSDKTTYTNYSGAFSDSSRDSVIYVGWYDSDMVR